jgi:hypothetical protein
MASAGKGEATKTAAAGLNNIASGQSLVNQGQNIANSEVNTSGGLSPLVSRQLANEQGQIGKTYSTAAQTANRGLSMRGMGVAPSGLSASITNTGINNEGIAKTGAVGGAFGTQNQLNNTALTQPINALNADTGAVKASSDADTAEASIPSTAGNILTGLSGLSGMAKNISGFQMPKFG